jgi:predicted transcriptional regulator
MEQLTKTITMEQDLADRIQALADKERRSFAREAQVLLEAALARQVAKADGSRGRKTA